MAVQIRFNDTEEYSFKSIAILGCNICSKITVAHVTLPKAVLSTVEIFAVRANLKFRYSNRTTLGVVLDSGGNLTQSRLS